VITKLGWRKNTLKTYLHQNPDLRDWCERTLDPPLADDLPISHPALVEAHLSDPCHRNQAQPEVALSRDTVLWPTPPLEARNAERIEEFLSREFHPEAAGRPLQAPLLPEKRSKNNIGTSGPAVVERGQQERTPARMMIRSAGSHCPVKKDPRHSQRDHCASSADFPG